MSLGMQNALPDPRIRSALLVVGTSMLLWFPCAAMSTVFFLNDRLYGLTMLDPRSGTSLVDDYRALAHELEDVEGFHCLFREEPVFIESDRRDLLLQIMQRAVRASAGRQLRAGRQHIHTLADRVEEYDFAVIRPGTAVDLEHWRGLEAWQKLEDDTIDPFCDAQEQLRRLRDPPLPPISVYAKARAILLDAASGMETVLAHYSSVRPWLLAFFYVWIAYSFVGLGCAILLIRRYLRSTRRAASRDEEREPRPGAGN